MSKKDFSVALKYVEARPRSQRRKGAEARVSGISVVGSGASATDLSLLQANLISVTNNFTALKDLFDSMFEKDPEGNIHAKLSLWSSGGITAGDAGSGGSGGGISYNRLDSWSDYSADKAGYVLSALLGKDLDNRVSALANAGYITASYLAPYALRSEIPSLDGYFLTSNFTKSNIKATLGISDWALASVKPTYTASEVGALGVNGTATNARKLGGLPPVYRPGENCIPTIGSAGEMEIGKFIDFHTQDEGAGVDYSLRIECQGAYKNRVYFPTTTGTLALTSDIPTKLSQLTDDVVAGNYLSKNGGTVNGSITAPSFIGNLTGTADKASTQTVLYGNRDVNLWDTDSSAARYFALGDTAQNTPSGVYALGSILMEYSWDTNAGAQLLSHNRGNNIFYRSRWNGAFKDWREIAFTDSNVASATKLQTPRTIWGQSFDGTGDITGALTAPSITANSITIGGATITYDSVNEALCINGNMYALGGITAGGAGISAYTSLEARVARLEQQLNIS